MWKSIEITRGYSGKLVGEGGGGGGGWSIWICSASSILHVHELYDSSQIGTTASNITLLLNKEKLCYLILDSYLN
jgi:hypothetical protein